MSICRIPFVHVAGTGVNDVIFPMGNLSVLSLQAAFGCLPTATVRRRGRPRHSANSAEGQLCRPSGPGDFRGGAAATIARPSRTRHSARFGKIRAAAVVTRPSLFHIEAAGSGNLAKLAISSGKQPASYSAGKEIVMSSTQAEMGTAARTKRVHIVMDRLGDTRHEFDVADAQAVALAEERFRQLTGSGFRAAALSSDGSPGRLINTFDPQVERTLFIPHLQGG
jgi:hypothetical protein